MVSISEIIKQINQYTEEAGHPPPRIAVTPDQMDDIIRDQNATRFLARNNSGHTTISGVVVDVWGRPVNRPDLLDAVQ